MKPATAEISIAMKRLDLLNREEVESTLGKSLPDGWVPCKAENGEVYYYCINNGATQWAHPGKEWLHGRLVREPPKKRRTVKPTVKDTKQEATPLPEVVQHSVYDAHSRNVALSTPKTLFADGVVNVQREDLMGRAFALHHLLMPTEAASYASAAEATGFSGNDVKREFPTEVRNNSRIVHFSDALAAALWRRLSPYLVHRDIFLMQPMGFGAEGRWKPVGVNPCFRISRYLVGEHFASHRDGMYVNDDGECSIYSLIIYLNDDFTGGELELFPDDDLNSTSVSFKDKIKNHFMPKPKSATFRPVSGSAVLLPHDMLHAAKAVTNGAKYVARSELMFRCVDALRPPSVPNFVNDLLFQRMAALYEQIGDLAALGDSAKTTSAYQEALGIQIAHQGTSASAAVMNQLQLPLPDKVVARALSFLTASDVLQTASISLAWLAVMRSGLLWRSQCQRFWPKSVEVQEDAALSLDPELKDWMGLFRRNYLLAKDGISCTVFLTEMLQAQCYGKEVQSVGARMVHEVTHIGWDTSFKQRSGWHIGDAKATHSWLENGKVDWTVLPELLSWAFSRLQVQPSDRRLIIPTIPGIWTKSVRTRIMRVLTGRFRVPKVCFVPAPLCALLAHNMRTGTVVWGCSVGKSMLCCYHDAVEVFAAGPFDFLNGDSKTIAELLCQASTVVSPDVLKHIIFSSYRTLEEVQHGPWRVDLEMSTAPLQWENIDALRETLSHEESKPEASANKPDWSASSFHEPIYNDVLIGAGRLASSPELVLAFEAAPDEAACWEWREFVNGRWCRLPDYVAGVLEGAFRNGAEEATVSLKQRRIRQEKRIFVQADLVNFTICQEGHSNAHKLTRFLRGHPSATPDLRKPEHLVKLSQSATEGVQEVAHADALHVRTMTGSVVFSAEKDALITFSVRDLLESIGTHLGKSSEELSLLAGAQVLSGDDDLTQLLQQDGTAELIVLIREKPPALESELGVEPVPEDMPGDFMSYYRAVDYTW